MMEAEITTVLFNLFFIFGIWWLVFVGFRQCRIDAFRQELFSIRDDLFAYARNNDDLPFDSKAHVLMRTTLNGMIRYTHQFTLTRSLAMVLADKFVTGGRYARKYENQMINAMLELPPHANKKLKKAREAMHMAVLKYVIASSPLLWVIFLVAFVVGMSSRLFKFIILGRDKVNRRRWASIDAEAEHLGESINSGCMQQAA